MSGVSLPVTRPSGRALLIGNAIARPQLADNLLRLGYACGEADEPYGAMAELCRRPLAYQAVVLSLASLYREELSIIRAIKRRFPHLEIWLAHTDGRPAALAEAMRLGADGLLDPDGLHRVALGGMELPGGEVASRRDQPVAFAEPVRMASLTPEDRSDRELDARADEHDELASDEPLLSADELRALLQEQPSLPQAGDEDA